MTTQYTFHTDPGHGWLEVPIVELNELGIVEAISPYSYRNGDKAYLEEDCDLATFIRAKKARGEEFELREVYRENTPIRNYLSFWAN